MKIENLVSLIILLKKKSSPKDMFIDFRERKKEREKHWLFFSCICPDWGSNLPPRVVFCPGIEPTSFWCMGWCSNQLSLSARALSLLLSELSMTESQYFHFLVTRWLDIINGGKKGRVMARINISALPVLMKFYMGSGTSTQMNIPH